MISLCMDSAYKALVLGLYKDGTLIDGVSIEAFKKQSETIFVELNQLFEKTGLDYKDVDEVIITDGPGSYTGIRIAMTIAKVFCTQMHKTLKCISTMQLFAGMDESANVILDARSKRAYVAHLEKGVVVGETQILEVDQLEDFLNEHPGTLYGDGYLVNQEAASCDFLKNFMGVPSRTIENVHALVPQYLKEMKDTDLVRVLELEQACFKQPWLEKDCLYELNENPFSHGWILEDGDTIVGYAFLWETFEMAQLARIGVDPDLRKRGYGKEFMMHLFDRAREAACEYMTLEVRASNEAALNLYQKMGFIQVNVSKNYYPDGEDAIVMTLAL